ncbi:MAG TPA: hypothetical protein DCE78_00195 [Bacteroidetes bacterium]|nr:hypothetical protein [Bacteroidota bacterium]
MKLSNIFISISILVLLTACTSSKWVSSNELVLDIESAQTLESFPILKVTTNPTPNNPILEISVYNNRLIQSPMRYESQRVIQKYRPRYGFMAAGILGSAALFYIASTDKISERTRSKTQQNILRLTGVGALLGGALQLKPVGPPIYTGEKKIFGETDLIITRDSSELFSDPIVVRMNAAFNGSSLVSGIERAVTSTYTFNLIDELRLRSIIPDSLSYFDIQLVTNYQVLDLKVPVDAVMNKFVRINGNSVALRSSPSELLPNVITTVAEASFLPWVESLQNGWYKVMLGATPAYVNTSSSELVWRVSNGSSSDFIVTTPAGNYGSVDVETNIPVTDIQNQKAIGIIFTNENYGIDIKSLSNAHRSGKLVQDYLINALGYQESRVLSLAYQGGDNKFYNDLDINQELNLLNGLKVDSDTDIFFYFNGISKLQLNNNIPESYLIASSQDSNNEIHLDTLVTSIKRLNPASFTLILDTDYSNTTLFNISQANVPFLQSQLQEMLNGFERSSIFLASNVDQIAGNYVSRDLRTDRVHGILTYYFTQAIKDSNTQIDQIREYLRRNVAFTSRRLHDRTQDPIILYNESYNLLRPTSDP